MDELLTEFQRGKLCQIIDLGCDRATAAKYFGLTAEQLQAEMDRNEQLSHDVLHAEAQAEIRHMGNVHKAAKDEKNWRTSVWWLEHRARMLDESADSSDSAFPAAVLAALDRIAELIIAEVTDLSRRQAILSKLLQIAAESVPLAAASREADAGLPRLPAPKTSDDPGNSVAASESEEDRP